MVRSDGPSFVTVDTPLALRQIGGDGSVDISILTTASRFTGASIAGLVVGAMGVFVFTVALRHWLRERRKFREQACPPDRTAECYFSNGLAFATSAMNSVR